jgi:NAD(P)-dependent dehydrogenase (short-subunit alcohol dehydrogenase family)
MERVNSDRVAIVVGGASGIGLATARQFAIHRVRVAIWDQATDSPAIAESMERELGTRVAAFETDVGSEDSVHQAMARTCERFGHAIDHLVHSVAIGSGRFGFPFLKLKPSDWLPVLQVNVMGMVHVAHAVAPGMIEQKSGTMVFISSVAGQIGSQTDPPYSASKAANINFAQCIAKDLAPSGVRVNTVCPGMVRTPLNRSVWQSWYNQADESERLDYEEWSQRKIQSTVPLQKWQTPEDIAHMIYFLSSDKGAHITGQTINVDGGYVMHW